MADLIDRQAAIDALDKRFDDVPMELTTEILQLRRDLRERIPSAQPATNCSEIPNNSERTAESAQNVQNEDLIQRKAAIEALTGLIDQFERTLADIRASKVDDSVCGMCEYDGAYMGQSGDWCNECPGFDKDDCFKLSEKCRKRWMDDIALLFTQPKPEQNTHSEQRKTDKLVSKTGKTCADTINRQAAIDALDCINGTEEVLRSLPSAQPEMIRCKDCKHMIDTGDDLMCDNTKGWVVATASDFGCVLAERRTDG